MADNILFYGDNLDILKRYVKDETVDLVYLDPPFNSNSNYNVLFEEKDGSKAASQIHAFTDTWTWSQESEEVYADILIAGGKVADCLQAFRTFLSECDMLAYLVMMAPRLVELRRVMKPTASIYLHCDPTASHYLKMLMDSIFKPNNFRNEIIWSYKRYTAKSSRFQRLHDVILFYGKGDEIIFNEPRGEYGENSGKADSHYKLGEDGLWFRWQKRKGQEPYKIYLSEGRRIGDVWEIPHINASAKERLGYPTQKPLALLERLVAASSNPGGLVLDPFCGCGTTIDAAEKLDRKWIGIDITHLAINLIKVRLNDSFTVPVKYNVIGEPVSISDAKKLAESEPFQFQAWALGLVGARVASSSKKGADKGIDGKIVFEGDKKGVFETIIISVKAGKTGSAHVRDLKGVVEREKAVMGVLISMQSDTKDMKIEAATAGFYESSLWGKKYPKIQLLTITELLNGKKIDMPPIRQVGATFKKAPKPTDNLNDQLEMDV